MKVLSRETLSFGEFSFIIYHTNNGDLITANDTGIFLGTCNNVMEKVELIKAYLNSEHKKAQERIILLEKSLRSLDCYYAD